VTELAIALLAFALFLFVVEAHVPGFVFGTLGIASLVAAGLVYRDAGHDLPIAVIVVAALILGAFMIFAGRKVIAAHRDEPVHTGWEELIGSEGEVREPLDPDGQIFVGGALWKARLKDGGGPIGLGNRVRVESVDGLTLLVSPAEATETSKEG
jgi:membrane-bound serine protease (ClpP class)